MFNIRFYNETGSIDFGGGKSESQWKVTNAEGLSFCGRTFQYIKYNGNDGQKTTDVSVNARTITLSGDVLMEDGFARMFDKAMAVLENEGTLEINSNLGKRKIMARCCDFFSGEKKGGYLLFTVQFLCDDPYFEDADKTELGVFTKTPLLDSDFTFPGEFSKRVSEMNIEYLGTQKTEPVFMIAIDEEIEGENLLIIENKTTNESIKFNYGGISGEYITVDFKNCKIYNSAGENLLKYLADDSFFGGFHLLPGSNIVAVTNKNASSGLTVSCIYSNRYSEAVYI